MTYEELKIQLDINDPVEVLKSVGRPYGTMWFVICDSGDCHLLDTSGEEHDIICVKSISQGMVMRDDVKRVITPNYVTSIGQEAFYWCTGLKSVKISSSVKSIGEWAFSRCTRLKSIEVPGSVKSIGYWAFEGCIGLRELAFKGKTLEQVKAMQYYPWGIKDESIIKCI